MTLTYKFLMNFTVAGVKISLGTNIDENEKSGDLSEKFYYGGTSGLNLQVKDLIDDLLDKTAPQDKPSIPDGLLPDLVLKDLFASYNGKSKEVNIVALASISEYEVKFFFHKANGKYAFGIQADISDLSGLPMVGSQMKDVRLANVGFVYCSKDGEFNIPWISDASTSDPSIARQIMPDGIPKDFIQGFNLAGDLFLPFDNDPFSLELPVIAKQGKQEENKAITPEVQPKPLDPAEKWFKFGKKIGPLYIGALGLSYKENDLSLLFRGDVSLAGLTVSLESLGLSFNLSELLKGEVNAPSFSLNGLGLGYDKPPVEISGAFLKTPTTDDTLAFSGVAVLKAASFTITGMGAYSTLPGSKESSLFIYALYDKPIGGPSFFFVTGLAAGFGYNRKVRIPEIEEVRDFPLVKLALNPDSTATPTTVLNDLTTTKPAWIMPSSGDYWLAVGIKFTSFKIIESFVLLIVELGHRVAFNILGLSVLRWPAADKSQNIPAIAYVELAVKATFGPDSDEIAVRAMITPNSFVFDKNCKLAGGFAFYTWVSGEHEGDFVITLGGYHPRFSKPAHYPDVDRLSLNWKISSALTMKGEMYYALTPSAIMAGGRWEVSYDISFLRVYLIVWADIFIQWAPFHYALDVGVRVGVEARIKVLFVYINFKVEIGAQLHIWGPPFAGEIYVDWSIFSFTIPFGDHSKEIPPPLDWKEFCNSFIPLVDGEFQPLATRIQDGIIKTITDDNEIVKATIVNPYSLTLAVDSFLPLKEIYSDSSDENSLKDETLMSLSDSDFPGLYKNYRNEEFGIKPMKVTQLNTNLHIWLLKKGEACQEDQQVTDDIAYLAKAKGMPRALWARDDKDAKPDIIPSVVAGVELHTTEKVDTSIVNIILGEYDLREKSEKAIFYANKDALGKLSIDVISNRISENINNPEQKLISDNLQKLGFKLSLSDNLAFGDLGVNTPLYLASIGQKIPKIIQN